MMINWLKAAPYIVGAVAVLILISGYLYMSRQIHHWHSQYDTEHVLVGRLQQQITNMTSSQNDQKKASDQTVIKVVQGPREVQSIIKEVQSAPAKPCVPPAYSDEVKNAF